MRFLVAFVCLFGCSSAKNQPHPFPPAVQPPVTETEDPQEETKEPISDGGTPEPVQPHKKKSRPNPESLPKTCSHPKAYAVLINGQTAVLEWCNEGDGGIPSKVEDVPPPK